MSKDQVADRISNKKLLNIISFFDEKKVGRFVARNIFKNNFITRAYWAYLLIVIFTFIYFISSNQLINNELRFWIIAVIGSFIAVLVPIHIIHEYLRSRLIKNIGNVKVNYLWSWKNMILKVRYDELRRTSKKDLIKVNILPFLLFSITPYVLALFTKQYVQIFFLCLAFFHGIYSIKAFALLSFLKRKKKQKKQGLALN